MAHNGPYYLYFIELFLPVYVLLDVSSTLLTEANTSASVYAIKHVVTQATLSSLPFKVVSDFCINTDVEVAAHKKVLIFYPFFEGIIEVSVYFNIP